MRFIFIVILLQYGFLTAQDLSNTKVDGYKAIWFELNQKYPSGDKYSGALGTYTAKHTPLAIYAAEVDRTYFVYGGTKSEKERHLLCMIGYFDHSKGMVCKPTVVHDKMGVDDPHDNPSLLIDDNGYLWVFVSGRGRSRPGFKYRSTQPWDIEEFEQVTEEEMTYPQPWKIEQGFFQFFTKYTGVRQLYFESSLNGTQWTEDQMLAAIPEEAGQKSGHYQTSGTYDDRVVGTFFNRHPDGNVDMRTDLYYVQSDDLGKSWTDVMGQSVIVPIKDKHASARVLSFPDSHRNIYLKDMGFDQAGHPACLIIRSKGHVPGPDSAPYEWCIVKWDGEMWTTSVITTSDHNYDMGSLYISDDIWKVVGPTEIGPQLWGVGGEVAIWTSADRGVTWAREKTITSNSPLSHSYVRRPLHHRPPFSFFWADGDSHTFSKSELYFGDFDGNIWKLPYDMKEPFAAPEKIVFK